jgi:hypothetical protein
VLRPRITIETDDEVLAELGSVLTSPTRPRQTARVVDAIQVGGRAQVLLELQGGMGRSLTPEPGSVPCVGESVCYAAFSDAYQPPPAFPEPEDTPWTHGGPPPPYIPADDDAREAWS